MPHRGLKGQKEIFLGKEEGKKEGKEETFSAKERELAKERKYRSCYV